jgi:hypothetical protein
MLNRKRRKVRKMELRKHGLEQFYPNWYDIITTSAHNFPFKISRHFNGMEIMAGKLRGHEFTRTRKNV